MKNARLWPLQKGVPWLRFRFLVILDRIQTGFLKKNSAVRPVRLCNFLPHLTDVPDYSNQVLLSSGAAHSLTQCR